MIELDFSDFPINPEQSRSARKQLGLTQSEAGVASGLSINMVKLFEKGRTYPPLTFLEALRNFYEEKGITFQDADNPGANAKANGLVFPAGVVTSGDDGSNVAQTGKIQRTE